MLDKNWRQEPGGRRDGTCDHGLLVQQLESRSVKKKWFSWYGAWRTRSTNSYFRCSSNLISLTRFFFGGGVKSVFEGPWAIGMRNSHIAKKRRLWVNPFSAPESLPILTSSKICNINRFPVVPALKGTVIQGMFCCPKTAVFADGGPWKSEPTMYTKTYLVYIFLFFAIHIWS